MARIPGYNDLDLAARSSAMQTLLLAAVAHKLNIETDPITRGMVKRSGAGRSCNTRSPRCPGTATDLGAQHSLTSIVRTNRTNEGSRAAEALARPNGLDPAPCHENNNIPVSGAR